MTNHQACMRLREPRCRRDGIKEIAACVVFDRGENTKQISVILFNNAIKYRETLSLAQHRQHSGLTVCSMFVLLWFSVWQSSNNYNTPASM